MCDEIEALHRQFSAVRRWLNENQGLASWMQSVGVVTALVFGSIQVYQATNAIQASADANEIALENSASDLLMEINRAALDHPEAAGDYPKHKRLHLLRLHYFHRVYGLRRQGFIGDDAFEAETEYLKWAGTLPDFLEIWEDFRKQYPSDFRLWADTTLGRSENASQGGSEILPPEQK